MAHAEGCVCFRCEVDGMNLGQAAFFCQDQADAHRLAGRNRLADAWDKRKVRLFEIQGHILTVGKEGDAENEPCVCPPDEGHRNGHQGMGLAAWQPCKTKEAK